MRIRTLAIVTALLLVAAAQNAGAFTLAMTVSPCFPGAMDPDCLLAPGDTLTAKVWFDTEGALDSNNRLMGLGVGVFFDSGVLAYDPLASTAAEYAIGSAAPGNDLVPASTCPGTQYSYPTYFIGAPYHCGLYGLPPAQVQLDFVSSAISSAAGVSADTAPGGNLIATLVFRIVAGSDGVAAIGFVFNENRGGIIQTQTRASSSSPWTYETHTPTFVPEPVSALMIGLGLAGFGVVRRRSR